MIALLVRYNSNGLGLWLDSVLLGVGWISLDSGSDWVLARFGIGWVWARLGFVFMKSWIRLGLDSVGFCLIRARLGLVSVGFGWLEIRVWFGIAWA